MNCCEDELYIPQRVDIPLSLYQSEKGRYFVGSANYLHFSENTAAWACLCNPRGSDVDLHLNVWTVSSPDSAFEAQLWFNAKMPGTLQESEHVTTANFAQRPLSKPHTCLCYASGVAGSPQGGVLAYLRYGTALNTVVSEEDGKFILPPGGSCCVFIKQVGTPSDDAQVSLAFGWYEVPDE